MHSRNFFRAKAISNFVTRLFIRRPNCEVFNQALQQL